MMMPAEKGFDFTSINDFFDQDDDGLEISIDADSFFSILNEDNQNSHPLPVNPFYPSTENNQECGSALGVGYNENLPFHTDCGLVSESSAETMDVVVQHPFPVTTNIVLTEANQASFDKSNIEPCAYQWPNFVEMNSQPSTQNRVNEFNIGAGFHLSLPYSSNYEFISTNAVTTSDKKAEASDSQPLHSWLDVNMLLEGQDADANFATYDSSSKFVENINTYDSSSSTITEEASVEPFFQRLMSKSIKNEVNHVMKSELVKGIERDSFDASKEASPRGFSFGLGSGRWSSHATTKTHHSTGAVGGPIYRHGPAIDRKPADLWPIAGSGSFANFSNPCFKNEGDGMTFQPTGLKGDSLRVIKEASQASLSSHGIENVDDDDDDDIRIIEDISQYERRHPLSTSGKSVVTSHSSSSALQSSAIVMPLHHASLSVSTTRQKAADERLVFQALVQDLSQPKSEATPPDGCLTVPLLRHQRIALSWMVQKETSSLQCSGGILADDQGLGKTVSTIALILSEKPPSKTSVAEVTELETLDLDEEDHRQKPDKNSLNSLGASLSRGRPSSGTLVVCPTSVLRQWADELRNKVTREANLSVLVYHGSNRTKDPYELAKFDVVLTTYSIVSMEVPKQPLVEKEIKDSRKIEADDASSKKRKHPSSSNKKLSKREMDNALLESVCPLARVSWFRVVLDEAQSIKNHRTRVAQACWGLRAKRRWCLSGTPIQNAVDDLYSYFRFLKYDPYSVYNSFCSMVKFPISRNPTSGYKKLQAVLKGIMLRRTKGTQLDGKPIINLPPKYVKLRKVEFSEEERDFYSRLEADSRAQFQAYADSGTVKQNYVNILLLLLRLRQACDHPFLVRGCDSSSLFKSSIHVAAKLPHEQQSSLLSCLELSLGICRICSDVPEDAVVAICGHVFCNQCISEHLTGDDNQCPATSCKTQLSVSKVFSKATLKSCLAQDTQDDPHIPESYDQSKLLEHRSTDRFDSSKIKAALEVIQALGTPQASSPDNVFIEPGVADNTGLLENSKTIDASDNRCSEASNGLNNTSSGVKEKAIVFSQWTRMLDLLEACLKDSSIEFRRLDGTMSVAARDKAVKDFNTLPEVTVMIMSLKAASLGLNMVAACHVILLDLWWNPTTEDQAIDRAHRIGQTRPVTVVRLTVKDTVEDRILALQQRKRALVASAFGEDETGNGQTRLTVEDLKYLFRG